MINYICPVFRGRGFFKFTIMANEKNLEKGKATQFRSGEEAVKNGKKGGIASGEARREKSTLIGTIAQVIDVELNPDKVRQRVINLGYPPEMAEKVTPRLMIAIGFLNRCIGKADPNSIKLLAEFLGEYVETIRHELPQEEEDTIYRRKKDEVG